MIQRRKKRFLWSKPIAQGIQKDLILAPNYISLLLHQPAPTGLNTVNTNKHTMEFDVHFQCLLGRDSDKPSLIGLIWSSWRLFQTSKVMAVLYTLSQPPWIGPRPVISESDNHTCLKKPSLSQVCTRWGLGTERCGHKPQPEAVSHWEEQLTSEILISAKESPWGNKLLWRIGPIASCWWPNTMAFLRFLVS